MTDRLSQDGTQVACTVKDSDNLKRLFRRIVNDKVVLIRLHNPKPKSQRRQVVP
jgi:hypothetical protein